MRIAVLGLAVVGCNAKPGPGTLRTQYIESSGYFPTTPYAGFSSTTTSGTTPPPPVVTLASISCNADRIRVYVEASGWTGDGLLYLQDTSADAPQPGENHTIASFESATDGLWDHLERELPYGEFGAYYPDVSTGFVCPDVRQQHLTWAVLLDGVDEVPADCVVLGHDPDGWLAGVDPSDDAPAFDPALCHPFGG